MRGLDVDAAAVALEIDSTLALELEDACERALALARLDAAVVSVVGSIGHPALELDRRVVPDGQTLTLYLLGAVLMRWCLLEEEVEVDCWPAGEPQRLRLRYIAHARDWRVWRVERTRRYEYLLDLEDDYDELERYLCSFQDEEEKVLEMIRDAIRELGGGRGEA